MMIDAAPAGDLVTRLRLVQTTVVDGRYLPLCEEAASRIESDAERIRASEERAKMLFDAKNHWAERARAAETDAARYRWLRETDDCPLLRGGCDVLAGDELDAAIDSALAEEGRKP